MVDKERITLKDWLPYDYYSPKLDKFLSVKVVEEYGVGRTWKASPFRHKNIHNWCVLENDCAVGWNESPSFGWAFPIVKYKRDSEQGV